MRIWINGWVGFVDSDASLLQLRGGRTCDIGAGRRQVDGHVGEPLVVVAGVDGDAVADVFGFFWGEFVRVRGRVDGCRCLLPEEGGKRPRLSYS